MKGVVSASEVSALRRRVAHARTGEVGKRAIREGKGGVARGGTQDAREGASFGFAIGAKFRCNCRCVDHTSQEGTPYRLCPHSLVRRLPVFPVYLARVVPFISFFFYVN